MSPDPNLTVRNDMNIFKSIYDKIIPGEFFLASLFATLFLLFLAFACSLPVYHISLPFKISSALADSGVMVIGCMFFKGNWRFIGAALVFALGWLLLANLLYFRNFEDIIQASGYIKANVGDPAVIGGALSSFQTSDFIFLILPFIPLACLIWVKHKALDAPVRLSWKIGIVVLCVLSWGFSYAGVYRRMRLWYPDESLKEAAETIFSADGLTWRDVYERHGFTGYAAKCVVRNFSIGMDLTPSDIEGIRRHLLRHTVQRSRITPDSEVALKGRNLIMVIVESLPFKALEIPDAVKLIPTIIKEAGDSGTIVSKCHILAGYGRSSDAQFIYNTGLLPLRHEALADNYAFNDYPSIAKALDRPSMEIIGENKRLWLHSLTTKSYGFDNLVANIAPKGMDQDSIIFSRAEKEAAQLEPPFFLFISSISMHDPYDSRKVSDEIIYRSIADGDPRDKEYYARLSHFDRSLGRFLSFLRREGMFEESIIVILGDHEIRKSKISETLHDSYVPFIIINSPIKVNHAGNSTQLDVFPTILDMMGAGYTYLGVDYSGLGQSIFSAGGTDESYLPTDSDYRISEMIIKGRPSE